MAISCLNYDKIKEKDDDSEELIATTVPANRRDLVMSRWMTVLIANDTFIRHYYIRVYFLAIEVKNRAKSPDPSYIHTRASCQLLALMRIKPENCIDDGLDDSPPVFYMVLIFVQAFASAFFLDHFQWRMRANPNFGKGTYGLLSPYCPEHTHVIQRDLQRLEKGGYKTHPSFANCMAVLSKIPTDADVHQGCSAFFEKFPDVFFTNFRAHFDKHIVSHCWHDNMHLPYLIGGTPSLAKAFLKWIDSTTREDDDDETDENETDNLYTIFDDFDVQLPHLTMNNGIVTANIRQCMMFLTENADLFVLKDDHILRSIWPALQLQKMAWSNQVIDIYDKTT